MLTNSELKKNARQTLRGNWQRAIKLTIVPVILGLISWGYLYGNFKWPSNSFFVDQPSLSFTIVSVALSIGVMYTLLDWVRDKDVINQSLPAHVFGLSINTMLALLVQALFMSFVILIGSLLIVPGVIFWLMFSQSVYIYKDQHEADPNMNVWSGVINSVSLSESMMIGHKWELFKLKLSFLGWLLLSIATFGIGFIWLAPYYQLTVTGYYVALAAENREQIA